MSTWLAKPVIAQSIYTFFYNIQHICLDFKDFSAQTCMHIDRQWHAHSHTCMHTHCTSRGNGIEKKICEKRRVFERSDRGSMMDRNRELVPGHWGPVRAWGRDSSVGRASDWKARRNTDAGLSPQSSKGFFSQSQLPVQTLLQCP